MVEQRKEDEKKMYAQWQIMQQQMRRARQIGSRTETGKAVYDFEQVKEQTDELERVSDEILSMPNPIKFKCTFIYMISHAMTLLQLMAIYAALDYFMIFCIIVGQFIGFLLFGFSRRSTYLNIYNPLGCIVQFAFES